MRAHLYQGKDTDSGKWVQGDLVTNGIDYDAAIRINDKTSSEYGQIVKVDPATVCEYAGLTDKNGKRIFEGHIVRVTTPRGNIGIVLFQIGEYFDGEEHYIGVYGTFGGKSAAVLARREVHYEVIGNKWDNPELLFKRKKGMKTKYDELRESGKSTRLTCRAEEPTDPAYHELWRLENLIEDGKTRENELHEPKVETEEWIAPHGWQAKAYCPNCGIELSSSFEFSSKKNIAIDNALSYAPNYCPNCGARLKEVDE